MTNSTTDAAADVSAWMQRWQELINGGDIETARPMFDTAVVAYGSLTAVMHGRDELIAGQWSRMWPRLRDFVFDFNRMHILGNPADSIVAVAVPWQSLGRKGNGWYDRRGRCTLVLRRSGDGLRCVHSHFSMEPGIPPIAD
jgi:ketosteroid isomerase-like protein